MSSRARFALLLLALGCFVLLQRTKADAAAGDWLVTVKTSTLEKCLDFPDSKFKPVIRASVYFEQGLSDLSEEEKEMQKRGAIPDEEIKSTKFEDVFFSHMHILGLKRYLQLRMKEGTPGIIRILPSNSMSKQEEANAAANTTLRLFINLYLKKAALRSVFVPRDIFDTYVSELQRYGFRMENVIPGTTNRALLILSVKSEPAGRSCHMGYGY